MTWRMRQCQYCGDVFLGNQDTCLVCRMALKSGEVEISTTEEDGGPLGAGRTCRRKLTREEVLAMPRRQVSEEAPAAPEENRPQRRMKKAPADTAGPEMALRVQKTLPAGEVGSVLRAVSAFVEAAPSGQYALTLRIERVAG